MRRLALQIYLSFVAVLAVFALLSTLAWWVMRPEERAGPMLDNVARVVAMVFPASGESDKSDKSDGSDAALHDRLGELARGLHLDLAVHAPDGRRLASTGHPLPPPPRGAARSRIVRHRRGAGVVALALPDGRWLLARHRSPRGRMHGGFGLTLLGFAAALAIGSYPLVRRLTGRLERLRRRVDAIGSGDLSARVAVEGNDEIAAGDRDGRW